MRNASNQKCSHKLPLNPAGVTNSVEPPVEPPEHRIKLRATNDQLPFCRSKRDPCQ
jgi:hypothetical protein